MNQEENLLAIQDQDNIDFVEDLMAKAIATNEKTQEHSNVILKFPGADYGVHLRIDDVKLLFVSARIMPHMVNYLVNVLPNLLYPYIVAYLDQMCDDDHHYTVNDLFDLISYLDQEK